MGYMTELNTLVRLSKEFPLEKLKVKHSFRITRPRERTFPLHIAKLLVDDEFNFIGYCSAESVTIEKHKTQIVFNLISMFTKEENEMYKKRFMEAVEVTKEF